MFYEEIVINGVLHSRSIPHGEWTAKTKEQLTLMYTFLCQELVRIRDEVLL